mmetsp:Transcript_17723/g.24782  ORF Transcript_17723/g.24782 Transcript_17723/m.24782 type:complete len:130 (+) Transcript_17723:82-471(+)
MGFQTLFFGACSVKMYLQPDFGPGMLPTALACTAFSLAAVYGLDLICSRHIARIVVEKGGETVRLGYHNLFNVVVEKKFDLKDISLPSVQRNTKGDDRFFTVEGGFGYYIYRREGVLDQRLMDMVFKKR